MAAGQAVATFARPNAFAAFSSSSRIFQEAEQKSQDGKKGDQQQQQQRKGPTPEEGHGPAKSPFAVFAQVLKEEINKNKAWQENVKTLQGDVDKLADTQAMKRARDLYEKARVCPRRDIASSVRGVKARKARRPMLNARSPA